MPIIIKQRFQTLEDLPIRTSDRFRKPYMVHQQAQTKEDAADVLLPEGYAGTQRVIVAQPTLGPSPSPGPVTVEQCKEYLRRRGELEGSNPCGGLCCCCAPRRSPQDLHKTIVRASQMLDHYGGLAELEDLALASHGEDDPAAINFYLPCERVTVTVEKDPKQAAEAAKGFKGLLSSWEEEEIDMADCHVAFRRDTIGIVQQSREIYPDSGDSKQVCAACCACLGVIQKFTQCNISACLRTICSKMCSKSSAQDRHNTRERRRARLALAGPAAYASEAGRIFNLPRTGITSVDLSTYTDSLGLADSTAGYCGGLCGSCCPASKPRIKDINWDTLRPEYSKAPLELQLIEMPERIITLGLRNVVLPGHARTCDAVLRLYVSGIVHVDALLKIVKMLHRNVSDMRDIQHSALCASIRKNHARTAWVKKGSIGDEHM